MSDSKAAPRPGVPLDGAYFRRQAKEALSTFFAPIIGAAHAISESTDPVRRPDGLGPRDAQGRSPR